MNRFDGKVPGPVGGSGVEAIEALGQKVEALLKHYIESQEAQRMKDALKAAMLISKAGNAFFQVK